MSYSEKFLEQQAKERKNAISVEAQSQLYGDMLNQQRQIALFPNAQMLTAETTYNDMVEDAALIRSQQSKEDVEKAFVDEMGRGLMSKASAAKVMVEWKGKYSNPHDLFDAVVIYYHSILKFVNTNTTGINKSKSIVESLVLKYLHEKGINPEFQRNSAPAESTPKSEKIGELRAVALGMWEMINDDPKVKALKLSKSKISVMKPVEAVRELINRLEDIAAGEDAPSTPPRPVAEAAAGEQMIIPIPERTPGKETNETRKTYIKQLIKFLNPEAKAFAKEHGLTDGKASNTTELNERIEDLKEVYARFPNYYAVKDGDGFRKRERKVYQGKGITNFNKKAEKYYIDLPKLKNNILAVKYRSSRNFKIPPTKIDSVTRDVIMDIYENKFNNRLFDQLNDKQQATIQLVIDSLHLQDQIHVKNNALEELQYDFEKSKGQIQAGNDNPTIIKDLQRQTMQLMDLNKLSKSKGLRILAEIGLLRSDM